MKTVLLIGLGRFGQHVAQKLNDLGQQVMAVDSDEVYVSAEYVDVVTKLDTAITMTELLYGAGVSDVRVDLTEYAKQFLGNPYVWGGTSLTNGARGGQL